MKKKPVIFLFFGKIKQEKKNLKGDFVFEKRLSHLKRAFIFLLCVLCLRLGEISIINGKSLETMAQLQQQRTVDLENVRGNVTDRYGKKFTGTENETLYLNEDGNVFREKPNDYVLEFQKEKRTPFIAKHLIGYTSPDGDGKSGLEKLFNSELKGKEKIKLCYLADAMGRAYGDIKVHTEEAQNAGELRLTLDKEIQKAAEYIMDKHIEKGALVLLDAESFDVLAMVSRPSFNEEKLMNYEVSLDGELLNRALMSYNAGSVFKIVTASAALEKNSNYFGRYFDCRGSYDLQDGHIFACNEKTGHGVLYFTDAFAKSCNCSFYVTALETGGENIIEMAKRFGIGQKILNVNLEESFGNLPQRSIYSNPEILNISIGQGEVLITPLECAVMAATVANGGVRKEVNIIDGIKRGKSFKNFRKKGEERVISKDTASYLSDMMRTCVTSGTGVLAGKSKVSISGKTGSAESGWLKDGKPMVHGWFCGFFPSDKPEYAMAILSEGGESGSKSCVLPFMEMAEKINEIYPFIE